MTTTIKIQIVGSAALRELQGLTRGSDEGAASQRRLAIEAERTAKQQVAAAKRAQEAAQKAATAKERADQKAATATERAAQESIRSANRELQARLRNLDQLRQARERAEADATRDAKREAAKRVKIEQESTATRIKNAKAAMRAVGGIVGGGLATLTAGGIAASSTARGVSGTKDAKERLRSGNEFERKLTVSATQAGLSEEERSAAKEKIGRVSTKLGMDPTELIEGLETGQAGFNDFRGFLETLEETATIARSMDSTFSDTVNALGAVRQAFGLSAQEMVEAGKIIAAGSAEGSIEMKGFATNLAPTSGVFAANTQLQGLEGLRQFVGVSQGIGTMEKRPAIAATLVEHFAAEMSSEDTQNKLKAVGANVKGKTPTEAIDIMASNKKLQDPAVFQKVFDNIESRTAVTALISARNRVKEGTGTVDAKSIAGVDPRIGEELVAKIMANLGETAGFQFDKQNAELQVETIKNLHDLNDQVLGVNSVTNRLEKSFSSLALWSDAVVNVLTGAVGSIAAFNFLKGGGGGPPTPGAPVAGMGAAGGAGLWATMGTPVAAASGAAIAGTVGAGLAIGGAAGYGADKLTEFATGRGASDRLADYFLKLDPEVTRAREIRERIDGEILTRVKLEISDKRTTASTTQEVTRSRGATINTAAGPTMSGAGQ